MTIEIHGAEGPPEEIDKLADALASTLKASTYAKNIVVTTNYDIVLDLADNEQPFLRIYCTKEEVMEVVDLLESFNLNIEVVELQKFIPHK